MNPLHEGINSSLTVAALFVDIAKAFDMVDHGILLDKLWNIGFRGCVFSWFQSFITGRSQRVSFHNYCSMSLVLEAGVPQGSVLGPILFLVYINSIFELDFRGKAVAFADDISFAYNCCDYSDAVSSVNHDLKLLSNWFTAHKLLLSSKTKVMLFNLIENRSFNNDIIYHHISCSGIDCCSVKCLPIESVSNIKYLGLIVDCHLDWKIHISELKNSLHLGIRNMYSLRTHCPPGVLKIFYHALVESRLRYGICCWGGTYFETIKPLVIAQNYIVRVMHFRNRKSSSWPLFLKNKIFPLKHLYVFKVMNLYFDMSGNRRLSCHSYSLRKNSMYFVNVPKFLKTHFYNYFLVAAPTIFNKLPIDLRILTSKRKFVSYLKLWLFQFKFIDFLFKLIV